MTAAIIQYDTVKKEKEMRSKKILIIAVALFVMLALTACLSDLVFPDDLFPVIPDEPLIEEERSLAVFDGYSFKAAKRTDIILPGGSVLDVFKVTEEGKSIVADGETFPVVNNTISSMTEYTYMVTVPDDNTIILTEIEDKTEYIFRRVT